MQQHPVPRNISSFQFHLIGDMTLRQFGYLAGGLILGFLFYKFPLPPIFKWPLAVSSAVGGFIFAFVPIQERPLDKWLVIFIRSIFAPTQYLWQKEGIVPEALTKPAVSHVKTLSKDHLDAHQDARKKLQSYLRTLPKQPDQTINSREKSYINKTLSLFSSSDLPSLQIQPVSTASTAPTSTKPYIPKPKELDMNMLKKAMADNETDKTELKTENQSASQAKTTVQASEKTKRENFAEQAPATTSIKQKVKQQNPLSENNTTSLQKQPASQQPSEDEKLQQRLERIRKEKQALEEELARLKNETAKPEPKPSIIQPKAPKEKEEEPTIKAVSPKKAADDLGMPNLPQTPNIVIGVVKDTQKKLLPNIIITIKDQKGAPLRALKTNKLGQFVTATPLSNGTYFLEIEDPLERYVFDIAQVTLDGKIFLPIEITAKGEKEMLREKLNKKIFGDATPTANI